VRDNRRNGNGHTDVVRTSAHGNACERWTGHRLRIAVKFIEPLSGSRKKSTASASQSKKEIRMAENSVGATEPEASEALDFEVVSLNEELVAVNRC